MPFCDSPNTRSSGKGRQTLKSPADTHAAIRELRHNDRDRGKIGSRLDHIGTFAGFTGSGYDIAKRSDVLALPCHALAGQRLLDQRMCDRQKCRNLILAARDRDRKGVIPSGDVREARRGTAGGLDRSLNRREAEWRRERARPLPEPPPIGPRREALAADEISEVARLEDA
jgi:hypothetical protein